MQCNMSKYVIYSKSPLMRGDWGTGFARSEVVANRSVGRKRFVTTHSHVFVSHCRCRPVFLSAKFPDLSLGKMLCKALQPDFSSKAL